MAFLTAVLLSPNPIAAGAILLAVGAALARAVWEQFRTTRR
jgi:hypothetical protein